MSIKELSFQNFRNLRDHRIALSPSLNWVVGANGSGKTSLLESLYCLSTARSFRARQFKYLVSEHSGIAAEGNENRAEQFTHAPTSASYFTLFGTVLDKNQKESQIGLQKGGSSDDKGIVKLNGKVLHAASALVAENPICIVQPSSFDLLYGAPKVRRRFFDWGVFHVEHAFRDAWKQYNNCLKQRNSLLRAGRIDRLELAFWDKQIVSFGEQVTEQRKAFLAALVNACSPILRHLLEGHVDVAAISLQLKQGWDKNKSLEEALALQLEKDCDKRFTQLGPHRADLSISVDNKPADQWLSRGQQKLLIVSMYLAQVALIQGAAENKIATVLLDDLSAELDQTSITKLLAVLRECGSQVVVTSVDDRLASMQANGNADDAKVFHVEHGNVSERV